MTFNDLCAKIHLPSVMNFHSQGNGYTYFKIPGYGWYGRAPGSGGMIFNFIDMYKAQTPGAARLAPQELIGAAYRFYAIDHQELLESPITYSDKTLNDLAFEYHRICSHKILLAKARLEALEGTIRYRDKPVKLVTLLEDLGMPELIKSGIGVITQRVANEHKLKYMNMPRSWYNHILIPSYYSIDDRIASLEVAPVQDLSRKVIIYKNREMGWYGRLGEPIVGGIQDLLTVPGCTWDRKIAAWGWDKPLTLHHSLQAQQCIDIWCHGANLTFDKSPIVSLKDSGKIDSVKDYLKDLTLAQTRELEKLTGKPLYESWRTQQYKELMINNVKFSCKDDRYYYERGKNSLEFSNFIINLTKIVKEDGVFYQYGNILKDGEEIPFKVASELFYTHHLLMQTLHRLLLEAGVGIPMVAPNMKHYLVNVINGFNIENKIEKPSTTAPKTTEGLTVGEL